MFVLSPLTGGTIVTILTGGVPSSLGEGGVGGVEGEAIGVGGVSVTESLGFSFSSNSTEVSQTDLCLFVSQHLEHTGNRVVRKPSALFAKGQQLRHMLFVHMKQAAPVSTASG